MSPIFRKSSQQHTLHPARVTAERLPKLQEGENSPLGDAALSKRAPTYCLYRKNYARVKIEGQWVHLGPYGSEESQAK